MSGSPPHLAAACAAIDFIEDNLKESITVADMAEAASYSLYHFCRTFASVTHHTPYDYLMRRRLSESARELAESERRIIDIALDFGFNNPETYSRAFKRMFGLQPTECRKQGGIERRLLMSRLTPAHVDAMFSNTEEWYDAIPEDSRPAKEQPFYHLLAENDQSYYVAYVSEQNLLPDFSGEPVDRQCAAR